MKEITLILDLEDKAGNLMSGEFTVEYQRTTELNLGLVYLGGVNVTNKLSQFSIDAIAESIDGCLKSVEEIDD
jgi:hypothetical protein